MSAWMNVARGHVAASQLDLRRRDVDAGHVPALARAPRSSGSRRRSRARGRRCPAGSARSASAEVAEPRLGRSESAPLEVPLGDLVVAVGDDPFRVHRAGSVPDQQLDRVDLAVDDPPRAEGRLVVGQRDEDVERVRVEREARCRSGSAAAPSGCGCGRSPRTPRRRPRSRSSAGAGRRGGSRSAAGWRRGCGSAPSGAACRRPPPAGRRR